MQSSGAHTHPKMNGGGGIALVVLAVILAAAIAEPVVHAVTSVLHVVVEVLEVLAIVVASLAGVAAVAGLVCLLARLPSLPRHHRRAAFASAVHALATSSRFSGCGIWRRTPSHSRSRGPALRHHQGDQQSAARAP
jgi:uncharacterized membrane protein YozB (DUF420 family)